MFICLSEGFAMRNFMFFELYLLFIIRDFYKRVYICILFFNLRAVFDFLNPIFVKCIAFIFLLWKFVNFLSFGNRLDLIDEYICIC